MKISKNKLVGSAASRKVLLLSALLGSTALFTIYHDTKVNSFFGKIQQVIDNKTFDKKLVIPQEILDQLARFEQGQNISVDSYYDESFKFLMQQEGGFVNNPNDSGGATYLGISSNNFPNEYKVAKELADNLGEEAAIAYAKTFYKTNFWDQVVSEGMNFAQSLAVFDQSVLQGVDRVKRLWNESSPDVNLFLQESRKSLQRIVALDMNNKSSFREGWLKRIKKLDERISSHIHEKAVERFVEPKEEMPPLLTDTSVDNGLLGCEILLAPVYAERVVLVNKKGEPTVVLGGTYGEYGGGRGSLGLNLHDIINARLGKTKGLFNKTMFAKSVTGHFITKPSEEAQNSIQVNYDCSIDDGFLNEGPARALSGSFNATCRVTIDGQSSQLSYKQGRWYSVSSDVSGDSGSQKCHYNPQEDLERLKDFPTRLGIPMNLSQ